MDVINEVGIMSLSLWIFTHRMWVFVNRIMKLHLLVVPSYDVSCVLILLTEVYGLDFMTDIDINPSSMGPIFGVWIGPTLGVQKWTIRHGAAVIW